MYMYIPKLKVVRVTFQKVLLLFPGMFFSCFNFVTRINENKYLKASTTFSQIVKEYLGDVDICF